MRRDSILRSTSFRLALVFTLLFIGAFVIVGVVSFVFVKREVRLRSDARIEETYRVIARTYSPRDTKDLVDAVKSQITAAQAHDSVFLLVDAGGKVLAANMPALPGRPGWSLVPGHDLGFDVDFSYRLFEGKVGTYRLVVGMSDEETSEIVEIMRANFAWASLIVVVLALCGGTIIAMRAQRRFNAVRATMDRIAKGELGARIPLIGNRDDVDALSSDVNAALERLETVVDAMRQVSADIAHDLKTPLSRLEFLIETAADKHSRGEPASEELQMAIAETHRINETFSALLRIAQIEAGARRERFVDIDLAAIVDDVADTYRDVAQDEGQTLSYPDAPAGPVWVHGDRDLLVQLLANLIENAIRHCPEGTAIECFVKVGTTVVAGVADRGPGIPEGERGKVLRRLYRMEKSRTTPGSGLGLSLVKAVADLHGARLRLEDNEPGLRVSIELPLSMSSSEAGSSSGEA